MADRLEKTFNKKRGARPSLGARLAGYRQYLREEAIKEAPVRMDRAAKGPVGDNPFAQVKGERQAKTKLKYKL